jgi:DNA-binding GntR family transcriptional regulator
VFAPAQGPGGHPSEADRIYRVLRDRILSGELAGGEVLNQIQMAAEMGTSRTPIREALAHLAAERLVTVSAGRGMRVARLSVQDFIEVNQLRWLLEGFAARVAAERMPRQVAEGLWQAVLTLESGPIDAKAVEELDQEMHRSIAAHCGNQRMREYIEQLNGMMIIARQEDVSNASAGMLASLKEIVGSLRDRVPDTAEQLMRDHIGGFTARLPGLLANEGPAREAAGQ